ncbi:hypothetical protein [Cupriavidus basilensis]|uniref:hypothetical protein n=1 Tax=Cupriavidus basilensis TaxID=68895 RepID=UPI0034645484
MSTIHLTAGELLVVPQGEPHITARYVLLRDQPDLGRIAHGVARKMRRLAPCRCSIPRAERRGRHVRTDPRKTT